MNTNQTRNTTEQVTFWTSRAALYLVLMAFGVAMIFPFIYMAIGSLKTSVDFSGNPRRLLPYTQETTEFNGEQAGLYEFVVDGEKRQFAEAVINAAQNDVNKLRFGYFARPDEMERTLRNTDHITARQSQSFEVVLELPLEYLDATGEDVDLRDVESLTMQNVDQNIERVTRDAGEQLTVDYASYRIYLDGQALSTYLETNLEDESGNGVIGQPVPLEGYVPPEFFGSTPAEIEVVNRFEEREFIDQNGDSRGYDVYDVRYGDRTEELILFFTPRISLFVSTDDESLAVAALSDLNDRAEFIEFQFDNYDALLTLENFDRSLVNTAFVTILVVLGQVTTSVFGGYAFSRVRFKGRDTIFLAYLGSIMIPFVVLIVPMYRLMVEIGWQQRIVSLIVPWIFTAYGTFLMRQFFTSIPYEIEEAALLDGASRFRILWQIFIPLSTPAIATQTIFTFLYAWNSFLWPLFMFGDQPNPSRVLTLSLISLANRASSGEPNLVFTGAAVTILPPMIVFVLAQKYFVEGIATSGLKG